MEKNEKEKVKELLDSCESINEIGLKLKGYTNGRVINLIKSYITEYGYEYKFLSNAEEKYDKNPKMCKYCSEKIIFSKRFNDFCSSKCSAIYNNKLRDPYSVELKEKISESLKKYHLPYKKINDKIKNKFNKRIVEMSCVVCGNKYDAVYRGTYNGKIKTKQTCNESCLKQLRSINSKEIMDVLVRNGTHKGWTTRNIISYPEKFFMDVLKNNKLEYKHNFVVSKKDLGLDDNSSYFLDFYFEDKKIDLEIDGKQHRYRKEHDEMRDSLLENVGIKVYRIEWKNPINEKNDEYMKSEINKFINYMVPSSNG